MAIIEANNISLYYGQKQALFDINLAFEKNTVNALIGPSGCGKSTFLRTLNRMNDLVPNVTVTGEVRIDGENIFSPTTDLVNLRKKVGMVFQQPNPFPFSIYDNVAFGPRIHGITNKQTLDEIVETTLKQADVWDAVKDRLHDNALGMSGGQQQRLCIARVLAVKPEIILMDEPTSALDPISSGKIENLIYDLKSHYTIVIVTHNMQQASRISDNTAFFLSGKLIEFDKTAYIFSNPKDKRTDDYISGRFG
ncbi:MULTISPECIES: phosphate ABC transporter ATP-binding protein PstB [unclassified Granulicatella]|uniref:phosphate ABC transporter ATP-binding protein PstB n=1 Tax=unclassified Granulicatella TaxID=2630493 RepID=UPI0010747F57|nr:MULTISPECIES: phosphate ABC transporter ATP-binding protein PstB [unclassified Granulicatella]MBF0780146.1 phosphate ABC transporter ATP-binding protein [Granulicatella sp. 19428wC4_WM01]TFU95750.1 phosphate ABC transporter ATP-binding protein [Granulicatella sp. WM01]